MANGNIRCWVYLFEVKSVQSLIFETGKLREIIGASELVARLTDRASGSADDSLLGCILATMDANALEFSRRAGGALYVSATDQTAMNRFAALWELCVQHTLPGIEFVRALAGGESYNYKAAMKLAREQLQAARNCPQVHLPLAGPMLKRNPRTARPMVWAKGEDTLVDELSSQKRLMEKGEALRRRFIDSPDYVFPIDFEPTARDPDRRVFPFVGDSRMVAIVHADGTGLGQLLMKLANHHYPSDRDAAEKKAYRAVSEILSEAGVAAAKAATAVLVTKCDPTSKVLAARPVILGGEDFSAIVRADLAVEYAAAFLEMFETKSAALLTDAAKRGGAFEGLGLGLTKFTACAGIVYVKASQPFARAHALAESIVGRLKKQLKQKGLDGSCSALGFYRDMTGSLINADAAFANGAIADESLQTMLPAYLVTGTSNELPKLADFLTLVDTARKIPRGPLRQLLSLVESNVGDAKNRYERVKEVMQKDEKLQKLDLKGDFGRLVGPLSHPDIDLFGRRDQFEPYSCPLLDLATHLRVAGAP